MVWKQLQKARRYARRFANTLDGVLNEKRSLACVSKADLLKHSQELKRLQQLDGEETDFRRRALRRTSGIRTRLVDLDESQSSRITDIDLNAAHSNRVKAYVESYQPAIKAYEEVRLCCRLPGGLEHLSRRGQRIRTP